MKKLGIFFVILKKNIKLLLRSKSSAIIILFGPLAVVTLVGLAFNNSQNQFSLSVGVYSEKYSELTISLVQKLADKFDVYKFESAVDCVKYVRRGRINICIEFPPDLDVKKEEGSNEIIFYLDFSRINIAWVILETLTGEVNEKSTEISKDLTQILLTKLNKVHNESLKELDLLNNITLRHQNISIRINKIYSDLNSANLYIAPEEFRVDEIKYSANKMNDICKQITTETLNLIKDLDEIIDDMNCSTTSPATRRMDKTINNITILSSALNRTYGKNENGTINNSLVFYIEELNTKVGETQKQLNIVAGVKDSIGADSYIKKSIKENDVDFLKLNSSISAIENEISSIEIRDASKIVNPITTKIQPVTLESNYFNFLLPTLILLVVMITSILLSSTIVINERKSPSFFRNNIAPVGQFLFNFGTYFTSFLIILIQLAIFIFVAVVITKTSMLSAVPTTFLSLFLVVSVFVLAGMCIGYYFKSEETTTLASISISSLLLFFSNTIMPLESIPFYISRLAKYNPFVIGESLLKQSIIFHAPFSALTKNMALLIVECSIILIILVLLVKKNRKQIFYKHKTRY
ncbi:MAG: ABC transporter permease [Candidatus Woesearchaeota archaeon]